MVEVKGLKKYFTVRKTGFWGKHTFVRACDDISFSVAESKTLGVVGESGSGKTTTARAMLRLIEPDAGEITIDGVAVHKLAKDALRRFRKDMQVVFQDPYSSLNPRMTIEKILGAPFKIHTSLGKKDIRNKVRELVSLVGLRDDQLDRFPHEFSGGQRQRIGIARAIALQPKFIVLDEPVSALDVSIQGQILNLLNDLQDRLKLTYLFVAHDLAVVEHISDDVVVMYLGRIVEKNTKAGLYNRPLHPYTQCLMKSIPGAAVKKHGFSAIKGEVPSPENPPAGCHFHPRCPRAMERCREAYPPMIDVDSGSVACYLYDQ